MKRSVINLAYRQAVSCFARHHWKLPPRPAWDITDFGLSNFRRFGLTLINLASEPEYCEKLMYARRGQTTPCHTHAKKKEDIICRAGRLTLRLWPRRPGARLMPAAFTVQVDGHPRRVRSGRAFTLEAGSRVTLLPGIWHEFYPSSRECIIGEVSTANDDENDNFFSNPEIGRFPGILEDEPAVVRLVE
ncbi:MAG: D-lyxose ketol-isomerase [Verrucomicrobiales bacterium]|nr:D-lyxose ketol-isomerase [Verrucomicrobiales bacterium]